MFIYVCESHWLKWRNKWRTTSTWNNWRRTHTCWNSRNGYESKYKVWIKAPDPHTIHTPRSIPWSIPHDTAWSIPLMHTPDPYPWSVPLSRRRKTDAGPNAVFYPNTASGHRTATPVATTVVSTAASARCLRCIRAAAAAATTSHFPPRSCCYCCRFCCCSCWTCSRCWCWFTSSMCFW